jgi:sulfonate transport system substrate-binding protein
LARLTPAIGAELQGIADGFAKLQLIPGSVDMKSLVDPQFSAGLA